MLSIINVVLCGVITHCEDTKESMQKYVTELKMNNPGVHFNLILITTNLIHERNKTAKDIFPFADIQECDCEFLESKQLYKRTITTFLITNTDKLRCNLHRLYESLNIFDTINVAIVDDIKFTRSNNNTKFKEHSLHLFESYKQTHKKVWSAYDFFIETASYQLHKFSLIKDFINNDSNGEQLVIVNRFDSQWPVFKHIKDEYVLYDNVIISSRPPVFSSTFICNVKCLEIFSFDKYFEMGLEDLWEYIDKFGTLCSLNFENQFRSLLAKHGFCITTNQIFKEDIIRYGDKIKDFVKTIKCT